MQLFVWNNVSNVTTRYHDGGGLVVIANTLNDAKAMIHDHLPREDDGRRDGSRCGALLEPPEYTLEVPGATESRLFVFPDAGCC